jgi:ribulose-5-phosphate 4-epimerase/fuculose-1-phosphate aldolase
MSALDIAKIDLVIANKVLARLGAVDAYGHVSVRHPTEPSRFLLARSRAPELVEIDDIMEFALDGTVVGSDNRPPYLERFIHGAVFEARPDVHAVVHGHPRVLLSFTVTDLEMRPLFLTADEFGAHVPRWDIRDRFGDTNILIVDMDQGRDLARALGQDRVLLIRGHGFVGAGRSAVQLIRMCKALLDNAALQLEAMRFGPLKELTPGEIAARCNSLNNDDSPSLMRGFEYEAMAAGCRALFEQRVALKARA